MFPGSSPFLVSSILLSVCLSPYSHVFCSLIYVMFMISLVWRIEIWNKSTWSSSVTCGNLFVASIKHEVLGKERIEENKRPLLVPNSQFSISLEVIRQIHLNLKKTLEWLLIHTVRFHYEAPMEVGVKNTPNSNRGFARKNFVFVCFHDGHESMIIPWTIVIFEVAMHCTYFLPVCWQENDPSKIKVLMEKDHFGVQTHVVWQFSTKYLTPCYCHRCINARWRFETVPLPFGMAENLVRFGLYILGPS